MLIFNSPSAFLLSIPLALLIYYHHFYPQRGGRIPVVFYDWRGNGFQSNLWGIRFLRSIGLFAFWVGMILLMSALASPNLIQRQRVYLGRGIDIMLVLDASPSMAAQDFASNSRFETSQAVISNFIDERKNDFIGLVSFSSEAALHVPPTLDYPYLKKTLQQIKLGSLGNGTAIGLGVSLAALHLKQSSAQRKVIILLTDGDNNAGEVLPNDAAKVAKQLNIPIYAIGIGSIKQTELEFQDQNRQETLRGTLESGFDEETLRTIADTSSGAFFHAHNNSALDLVLRSINSTELVERRAKIRVVSQPVERLLLLFALICFSVELFIRHLLIQDML